MAPLFIFCSIISFFLSEQEVQLAVLDLNLSIYFCQLLNGRVVVLAVRTLQVFARFFEYLSKERLSGNIAMLDFFHLVRIASDVRLVEQHSVAPLANHLQDENQVLEVTGVVDRQTQLGVTEVSDAVLEVTTASRTPEQLGADSHATVDGSVENWSQRATV